MSDNAKDIMDTHTQNLMLKEAEVMECVCRQAMEEFGYDKLEVLYDAQGIYGGAYRMNFYKRKWPLFWKWKLVDWRNVYRTYEFTADGGIQFNFHASWESN